MPCLPVSLARRCRPCQTTPDMAHAERQSLAYPDVSVDTELDAPWSSPW